MDRALISTLLGVAASLFASLVHAAPLPTPADPAAIIGGGPVDACDWPSTVFLENCTGTLIHPEIVVYAAHCGDDRERVWFGEDISSGAAPGGAGFSVDTEYCWSNPDWLDPSLPIGPARAADFGFCKLARPVLEVPIVPAVYGCETTILAPGTDVTLVGYGGTDQDTFAVKFEVDTTLHYIDDWGAAVIGGEGLSPCGGDSGGPAFVRMPDGTWRAFGIVSGPNFGNCGDAMWFATIHTAIPYIEAESGIDVTPCHHTDGTWNPSPGCGEFPLDPGDGSGKSWADGCGGGEYSGLVDTCGPTFDASEDLLGPVAAITAPRDRDRFDLPDGGTTYALAVTAEIADAPSGVSRAELVIAGATVEGSLRVGSPWTWDLAMPPGVWTIEVRATDWAGNESLSDAVVIGIGEDPPAAPEPSTSSSGGESGDAPADSSGGDASGAGGDASSGAADTSGGGAAGQASEGDGGCGCRSSAADRPGIAVLGLFAMLGVARRRRRAACSGAAIMMLGGCGGDPANTPGGSSTSGESSGPSESTGVDPDPSSSGGDTTVSSDTSSGDSSSSGPGCEPGTEDCHCDEGFLCNADLACMLDTCVPCQAGAFACVCAYAEGEERGTCEPGLYCFGGLCAAPQPCPFVMDGKCDEPRGTGFCLIGTDAFDCCATEPDVCEEAIVGGACPDGSDSDDCSGDASSSSSGSGGSGSGESSSGGSGSGESSSGESGSGESGSAESGSGESGSGESGSAESGSAESGSGESGSAVE